MTQVHKKSSIDDFSSIIEKYPLFCLLKPKEINQLAQIAKKIMLESGTIITHEGDIIDRFWLIIEGTADVTKTITTVEQTSVMHVATLKENDAIGLGGEGFNAIRTATVTATSAMELLEFDLMSFNTFLRQPGIPYPALKKVAEKMLLMNFMQKTKLFSAFKQDKIEQLAKKAKIVYIKAGTILFNEGDIADQCYFILFGKIAILASDQHILATLGPSDIFGEGAFLDRGKRNASARVEIDSELFALDREQFESLITPEIPSHFQSSLILLRIQQIRPIKQSGVSIIEKKTPEGEKNIILALAAENKELQISHRDYAMWNLLDGKTTIGELFNKMNQSAEDLPSLYHFYFHLINIEENGFLRLPGKELIKSPRFSILSNIFKKLTGWWGKEDS